MQLVFWHCQKKIRLPQKIFEPVNRTRHKCKHFCVRKEKKCLVISMRTVRTQSPLEKV